MMEVEIKLDFFFPIRVGCVTSQMYFLFFVPFPVKSNPGGQDGQKATLSTFLLKYLDSLELEYASHRKIFVGSSSKDLFSGQSTSLGGKSTNSLHKLVVYSSGYILAFGSLFSEFF